MKNIAPKHILIWEIFLEEPVPLKYAALLYFFEKKVEDFLQMAVASRKVVLPKKITGIK